MDDDIMVADTSRVKTELHDEDSLFNTDESPLKTGVEMFGEELEKEEQKQHELDVNVSEAAEMLDNPRMSQKKKKALLDTEYLRKEKAELKTFGMSSRPRRAVNYANIERGDEATSKSLVTEFPTTKKRTKRTRDELDENFEIEETPKANKTKKTRPYVKCEDKSQAVNMNEFYKIIPAWNGERPNFQDRMFASKFENFYAIRRASGGFRRFIGWMSDATVCKLFTFIDENFRTTAEEDDDKMMQAIRQAWNMMPDKLRKKWEKAARMDAFESFKLIGSGTLPVCEIPIESKESRVRRKPNSSGIRAHCCSMDPLFANIYDAIFHFATYHDSVHFYGCQFCHMLFASKGTFSNHTCDGFSNYLMKLTMGNKLMEIKSAFMFVSCIDCGLWLPLRMKTGSQKFWPYFSAMMVAHSCKTLVPVIIYFAEELNEQEVMHKMHFSVFPRPQCGIEMSCEECNIESFDTVADTDDHFKTAHPERQKKCPRCDEICGTDFTFRLHVVRHFNDSLLFANYLRFSATYFPPEDCDRLLHCGYEKENVIVGGFDESSEMDSSALNEDMVDVNEDTIRKKLLNCMTNEKLRAKSGTPFSLESDDSQYSESEKKAKEPRADMGYEHIDYDEMFAENEEQKEAKTKLRKVMEQPGQKIFETGDVVIDEKYVLEALQSQNEKEKFVIENIANPLADEISRMYLRNISLPLSSCIDPLKDFLLINRIFYFCDSCANVFCGDPEEHAKKCGVDEDSFLTLFSPTMSSSDGIRCPDEKCETRVCSVISLRCHVALSHGRFLSFEASKPGRYDQSISVLTRHQDLLRSDRRSNVAKFTDADMGMPANGHLEKKNRAALMPRQTGNGSAAAAAASASTSKEVTTYPVVVSKLVKPFKENKMGSNSFDCTWCPFNSIDIHQFQSHLIKTHVYCCEICGKVFATMEKRRNHGCSRVFWKEQHRVSSVVHGSCRNCGSRMPLSTLFTHMITNHFSEVRYSISSGEIMPPAMDIRCETGPSASSSSSSAPVRAHERIRYVRFDLDPIRRGFLTIGTHPVSKPANAILWDPPNRNAVNQRLACYMCEMPHCTEQELDTHLERHPERYRACPFCKTPVDGHYKMQWHLLRAHTKRVGSTIYCDFCGDNVTNSPCTHHIYKCTRTLNCGMCGLHFRSNEDKVKHMANAHATDLRRFQCSYCAHVFITMHQYYNHSCSTQALYLCECNEKVLFKSVADFCDHYDSVHVEPHYVCGVCHQQQRSVSLLASHRQMHMQTVSPAAIRKVYILPKWAFPVSVATTLIAKKPAAAMIAAVATAPRGGGLTMQERLQAIFDKPSGSPSSPTTSSTTKPDVVTVEDDDDDDDDIVFEGTVSSKNTVNGSSKGQSREISPAVFENDGPPPLERSNVVNAEVRVETTESGADAAGGKGQPGYVDDDDIEFVSEVQGQPEKEAEMAQKTAKVTEVVDDQGDDELAVVAEVENVSGVTSSVIAATSREKKFKCTRCSCAFITNGSLRTHMETHKSDAGASTSTETFGLPIECTAWICRNCCLAFESQAKYIEHSAIHGDTQLTCRWCSGIAFNGSIIMQHNRGHDNNTVYYACGTCKMRFYSDLHLLEHLSKLHGISLFYFCKHCGYGATWLDAVYMHCSQNHSTDYTLLQRIGACPTSLLNYEPTDEKSFKYKVTHKIISCSTPSDCSHRSLLLASDCLVSCTTCHCTQSLHSYIAHNGIGFGEMKPVQFSVSEPRDSRHRLYPLLHAVGRNLQDTMMRYGQQVPRNTTQGSSSVNRTNPQIRLTSVVESRSPSGARVILPARQQQDPYQQIHGGRKVLVARPNVIPARTVTSRVVTNRPMPIVPTISESTPINDVLVQLAKSVDMGNKCETCNAELSTEFDKRKHEMHKLIDHGYMCGNCSKPEKTEMDLMMHYYNDHLAPVIKKKAGEKFRPLVYNLKCPHPECKDVPYKALKAFEKHVQSHTDLLPFESQYCGTRFGAESRMVEHDRKHENYEQQQGCDAPCCPLCGIFDMWTLPREQSFVLSHVAVHGLDHFSVCRICFNRHRDDQSFTQQFNHFENNHLTEKDSEYTCVCGITGMTLQDAQQHIREKHTFVMFRRSSLSKDGELVINACGQMRNYLGIEKSEPKSGSVSHSEGTSREVSPDVVVAAVNGNGVEKEASEEPVALEPMTVE